MCTSTQRLPSSLLLSNIKIILVAENKGLPLSASKKVVAETPVDEFEAKDLRSVLHLKVDHSSRPLWVVSILPVSLFLLMITMNMVWIWLRVIRKGEHVINIVSSINIVDSVLWSFCS